MDTPLKSLLTSFAIVVATSAAAWGVAHGLIPSADQSVVANDLVFAASAIVTAGIAWLKARAHTKDAQIAAVNNRDNGVKVIPNTPATASIPMAKAALK